MSDNTIVFIPRRFLCILLLLPVLNDMIDITTSRADQALTDVLAGMKRIASMEANVVLGRSLLVET